MTVEEAREVLRTELHGRAEQFLIDWLRACGDEWGASRIELALSTIRALEEGIRE